MDKLEKDLNGLQLHFLKTCQPNSFSKFMFVVLTFDIMLWERYLFYTKL